MLADSLSRQVTKPQVRRAILEGRLCLCTPDKPTAGFSVANAMGRNRLIYALSDLALVVVSDSGQGGTWEGAVEAIRVRLTDVVIWEVCWSWLRKRRPDRPRWPTGRLDRGRPGPRTGGSSSLLRFRSDVVRFVTYVISHLQHKVRTDSDDVGVKRSVVQLALWGATGHW